MDLDRGGPSLTQDERRFLERTGNQWNPDRQESLASTVDMWEDHLSYASDSRAGPVAGSFHLCSPDVRQMEKLVPLALKALGFTEDRVVTMAINPERAHPLAILFDLQEKLDPALRDRQVAVVLTDFEKMFPGRDAYVRQRMAHDWYQDLRHTMRSDDMAALRERGIKPVFITCLTPDANDPAIYQDALRSIATSHFKDGVIEC